MNELALQFKADVRTIALRGYRGRRRRGRERPEQDPFTGC